VPDLLKQRYELDPGVALRDEPFGALAYHFGTRRLTFLKTRELVAVVRALGDSTDLGEALARAAVPQDSWPVYARAVEALAAAGMVRERAAVAA
jgi:putative mycofactocin binding protein MftB